MTASPKVSKVPCVFPVQAVQNPVGTLVYFHPGGLPSGFIKAVAEKLPQWRVMSVELMLCTAYIEAVDRKGELTSSLEAIADEVVSQLRVGEVEALAFVGWSFGGVVAYEVASRWRGPAVPRLVFIDSIAPVDTLSFSDGNIDSGVTLKWFVQYLQALKSCRLRIPNRWVHRGSDAILQNILDQAITVNAFDPKTRLSGFRKVFTTFTEGLVRNARLGTRYRPDRYNGELLLIRARKGLLRRFAWMRHMGWKALVPRLSIKSLDFNHYQIISDRAAVEKLRHLIAEFVGRGSR